MGRNVTRGTLFASVPIAAIALLAPVGARALPPEDPNSIITIQGENDAVSTLSGTSDQYYTSGLHVAWTSPTDDAGVARPIQDLGHLVWGAGVARVVISLGAASSEEAPTARDALALADARRVGRAG